MFQKQHPIDTWILAPVLLALSLVFLSMGALGDVENDADEHSSGTAQSEATAESRTVTAGPQSSRPSVSDPQERQSRTPTPAERDREPALRERAEARWAALIDGDFDKAYNYKTPAYRDEFDRHHHAASFGDMVEWHLASVREVRYDLENEAEVVVSLTVSIPLGGGEMFKTTVPLPEHWVYVDNQWYHVGEAGKVELPVSSGRD